MVYIKLFVDYLDAIEPLGDAERGRLFTALLSYARTGEAPQLGGNERFLFPMMRAQLDRDAEAADGLSQKRREAAKANASKSSNCIQMPANEANAGKCTQDKDKDKDKETLSYESVKKADFDAFWAEYPRKVSKLAAQKAFAKVKAPLDVLLAALRAQKKTEQWTRDGGQYIPYPATWLNGQMWEDQLKIETEAKQDDGIPYFDRYR